MCVRERERVCACEKERKKESVCVDVNCVLKLQLTRRGTKIESKLNVKLKRGKA